MPPKKQTSKKTDLKKKEKIVEDKTFGLKNKKKSKAVQKYVKQVQMQVIGKQGEGKSQRKAAKEAKAQEEAELRALFKEMTSSKDKDKKKKDKKKEEEEKKEPEVDNRTLEEKIEDERNAVKKNGATPVTAESFQKWKEQRAKRKRKELEKKAKNISGGGKKGKGAPSAGGNARVSQLSGRELFTLDASIFKDDESAVGNDLTEFGAEEEEGKTDNENSEDTVAAAAAAVDKSLYLEDDVDDLDDLDDLGDD